MILADHAGKVDYRVRRICCETRTKTKNDDNFITHALCINAALPRIVRILACFLIAKKRLAKSTQVLASLASRPRRRGCRCSVCIAASAFHAPNARQWNPRMLLAQVPSQCRSESRDWAV